MVIENRTYARQHITVTSHRFRKCRFVECTFTLVDKDAAAFTECAFLGCTFHGRAMLAHTTFTCCTLRVCAFVGMGICKWRAAELVELSQLQDVVFSRCYIPATLLAAYAVRCHTYPIA